METERRPIAMPDGRAIEMLTAGQGRGRGRRHRRLSLTVSSFGLILDDLLDLAGLTA